MLTQDANTQQQFAHNPETVHPTTAATEIFANLSVIAIKTVYLMRSVYRVSAVRSVIVTLLVENHKFARIVCVKSVVATILYVQAAKPVSIANVWTHALQAVNAVNAPSAPSLITVFSAAAQLVSSEILCKVVINRFNAAIPTANAMNLVSSVRKPVTSIANVLADKHVPLENVDPVVIQEPAPPVNSAKMVLALLDAETIWIAPAIDRASMVNASTHASNRIPADRMLFARFPSTESSVFAPTATKVNQLKVVPHTNVARITIANWTNVAMVARAKIHAYKMEHVVLMLNAVSRIDVLNAPAHLDIMAIHL